MSLIKKLKKASSSSAIQVMSESEFAEVPYFVPLQTVLLNLITSARWDGGAPAGKLSMISGVTSSGKTRIAMLAARDFLNTHEDGVVILVDAEYASGKETSIKDGLDSERVLHIPLSRVLDESKDRNLTYQMVKIMESIEKDEKVMIIIDSVSALQGLTQVTKNDDGKVTKDMTHGIPEKKALLYRILEEAGLKKFPVFLINHVTTNVGGFGSAQVTKGGSILYIPSISLTITSKAKLKAKDFVKEQGVDDNDMVGSIMSVEVFKSRFSKESSKIKFAMHHKYGFLKYFGLYEYAKEGGFIEEGKEGRTTTVKFTKDDQTYEIHKRDMYLPVNYPFWEKLFELTDFGTYLNKQFEYGE